MTTVNRDSLTPTHSPELEAPPSPAPAASPLKGASQSEVEAFDDSAAGPTVMQGSNVGAIAAQNVGRLDANAVVGQVKELMSRGALDWMVTGDECRHALGLLESLPPGEYQKAIKALSSSGELSVLCEKMPAEQRRDLAESAVRGGLTTATPSLSARGLRDPQPPPQPRLIANPPSLPPELRQIIHGENAARGRQYEASFNEYVDAWCKKAGGCKTPLELRALGPLSHPPQLLEPGLGAEDFKARRFAGDLCSRNIGIERAAVAVSQQVSGFRDELSVGGFGLDFEVKLKIKGEGEIARDTEGSGGQSFSAKGTLTQDGRIINQDVGTETVVGLGRHGAELEGKFSPQGHLEAVAAEVGGFGVELEREGKTTFKVPVMEGVAVESFVNHQNATTGASLVGKEEAQLLGWTLEGEGKIGFTAKGIEKAYYADIGGTQEGFFGPMPELTAGKQWGATASMSPLLSVTCLPNPAILVFLGQRSEDSRIIEIFR